MARFAAFILFGLAGVLAFAVPLLLIWRNEMTQISEMPLNDWGDFLAGAFGPASLLVLAASFLLQQDELRLQRTELSQTRETLSEQKLELQRSAEEAVRQNKILALQSIISDWQNTKQDLDINIISIGRMVYQTLGSGPSTETDIGNFLVRLTGQLMTEDLGKISVLKQAFMTDKAKSFSHVNSYISQINAFENRLNFSGISDVNPWNTNAYFKFYAIIKKFIG